MGSRALRYVGKRNDLKTIRPSTTVEGTGEIITEAMRGPNFSFRGKVLRLESTHDGTTSDHSAALGSLVGALTIAPTNGTKTAASSGCKAGHCE